jgi:3-phosphoshikimate 1-carboxyvinyltransferase
MRRVVDPLRQIGAKIEDTDGNAPLLIRKGRLRSHEHRLKIASAQVKSAILLAGLYADGPTVVHQPGPARDHTERMLAAMGAKIEMTGLTVTLHPPSTLSPLSLSVPGDISSAAFFLVAAVLVPNSRVIIKDVGINPTRTGLLDVLQTMGAEIKLENKRQQGDEPVADLVTVASALHGSVVRGETVVRMIDEFPVLAVAATQAHGTTRVHDAAELRVKETDRIATTVEELLKMGAHIEASPDGFMVQGPSMLRGAIVDSHGDHRLAMAMAVAGLLADGETVIQGFDSVADSFPGFAGVLASLTEDWS